MADTSKDFTLAERAILRNQRLIMVALLNVLINQDRVDGKVNEGASSARALRERVADMDRNWEFIAAPSQRLAEYQP